MVIGFAGEFSIARFHECMIDEEQVLFYAFYMRILEDPVIIVELVQIDRLYKLTDLRSHAMLCGKCNTLDAIVNHPFKKGKI